MSIDRWDGQSQNLGFSLVEILVVIAITGIIVLITATGMVNTVNIDRTHKNSIEFERLVTDMGRALKYTTTCAKLFGDGAPDVPQTISLSAWTNIHVYRTHGPGGMWLNPYSTPPVNRGVGQLLISKIRIEPRTLLPSAQEGMQLLLADIFLEATLPEAQLGPLRKFNRQPVLLKVDGSNRIAGCNGVNPEAYGPALLPSPACTTLEVMALDTQEQWVCRPVL